MKKNCRYKLSEKENELERTSNWERKRWNDLYREHEKQRGIERELDR
jgi:hypothetical protein